MRLLNWLFVIANILLRSLTRDTSIHSTYSCFPARLTLLNRVLDISDFALSTLGPTVGTVVRFFVIYIGQALLATLDLGVE